MESTSKTLALHVYVSSTDKLNNELVYESIVLKAKQAGLAGATAMKGVLGYGASSIIHSYKFWELSEKLPVVIEIIDKEKKVLDFFESIRPWLENMRYGCLVTSQHVNVLLSKHGAKKNP
jgi:uncharacterized protein